MTPDAELLHRYAQTHSEDAFAEIVSRHVNLVYSAALRQVNGDAHLAQDVAQTVFTDLARKADSLARRDRLTGWLYTSAHFAAAKIVRTETRRRDREETFMRDPIHESAPEPDWQKLQPLLDAAMHELKAADREALLLRYFENQPFAAVGAKLGLNENAARMRVERALEKLRAILAQRGLAATATLASVISAHAVQAAPAGLAATLTTASILSAGTGTFTLMKLMTATKLKLALNALVVAGAATALVVQHQAQNTLRTDNAALTQQLAQLQTDSESLSNRLAAVGNAKSLPDDKMNELLKLRGEIGVLRRQLESQKTQAAQQPAGSKETSSARLAPGAYISKDQLNNAGFATPEAALQTYFHGFFTGNYDQTVGAMSAQIVAPPLNDPKAREGFEKAYNEAAASIKGFQIIAKKTSGDDKVDLEVLVFQEGKFPNASIHRMVKEGNEWKFHGSLGVSPSLSSDDQIQLLAPAIGQ